MIFHLLIVDDETIFRKGLSEYINWETYDCVVSATAKNGTEAIDIIESTPIDIVITDVRMPSLDGIGLAKYIHENHPEISVIILSGYSEFEYARSAIQYNVAEYLLKPAAKKDVINAVQNVAKKLLESKSSISKSEQAFLKDQFFQELTDHVVPDDSLNKLSNFDINLNNYYVAAFQLPDDMSMVGTLKDIIIDNKLNSYCFRYNNLIINVYFDYETEDTSAIIDNCNTIDSSFKMFTSLNVNAGISGYHHSARNFSTAVSEAILALSLNFYFSAHVVEFSSDYVAGKETFSADTNLLLHDFENSVIQLDFKSASDILGSIFNKLESNFSDENTVRSICTQIYLICYRVMLKSNTLPTEDEYINKINSGSDFFQLKETVRNLIYDVKKQLTQSSKKYSSFIEETITYIKEHIADDLSLELIAQNVHTNESYLSRTFKKECGHSIVSYITMLRISMAKDFLANTNLKTFEISDKIGIHDPAYFSVIFKKNTGLSPKDYRNKFVR